MPADAAARVLRFGEALPLLHVASNRNPRFAWGSMGGRFVLLCVVPDTRSAAAAAAFAAIAQQRFAETERLCAVVNLDRQAEPDAFALLGGTLVFNDPDTVDSAGLHDAQGAPDGRWLLLDPSLRVLGQWRLADAEAALNTLAATPPADLHAGAALNAPVLIAPRVFEPEFCSQLIAYYKGQGAQPSGVTLEREDGMTFVRRDDEFKMREDCIVEDATLRKAIMQRIYWRLAPEIEKAFMWRPTRMERYLVACYDAGRGGFFKPHRDNTTKGTAHRRFAVTINLNSGAYEGGDLRFPEFGSRTYRAPTGGAVVFSCSLLHEATPVTAGERFAFLPFLYDDAAAALRAENEKYLDESIRPAESD